MYQMGMNFNNLARRGYPPVLLGGLWDPGREEQVAETGGPPCSEKRGATDKDEQVHAATHAAVLPPPAPSEVQYHGGDAKEHHQSLLPDQAGRIPLPFRAGPASLALARRSHLPGQPQKRREHDERPAISLVGMSPRSVSVMPIRPMKVAALPPI